MGDGGVACVPSQHIMETFSICGGKTNGNTKLNSVSKTSVKLAKLNQKMKPKKDKGSELGSNNFGSVNSKEVSETNGSDDVSNENNKDEVEEGELGTLPFENGEFIPEKPVRRYGIKSEVEKGEFVPGKWRKGGGGWDKNDWSSSKEELEKGEFLLERWGRSDDANKNGEYGYSKARRYDGAKDKGWKNEREWMSPSARERGWRVDRDFDWFPPAREKDWKADREWSPPGMEKGWKGERDWMSPSVVKHPSEKEHGRSGGSIRNSRKFSSRYEAEKTPKTSSKIASEEGTLNSHTTDTSFGNCLKRHGGDFDNSERKYRVDYDDYSGPKNRKLSDDGSRSGFPSDHYSGRTMERSTTSSSRNFPSERYSSRYTESSRAAPDRHNSSPHHSDRSPHNRARNHDHRDCSPARRCTPSYYQGHQYERSRSPYDCSRHYENRGKSPIYVEPSPRNQGWNRDGRDQSPTLLGRSPRNRGRYTGYLEMNRKLGVGEKLPIHYGCKGQEGKHNQMKDSGGRESQFLAKKSPDRGNVDNQDVSMDKLSGTSCDHADLSPSPSLKGVKLYEENGTAEEPASMEENMDISNTPPHVPQVEIAVAGKWHYLDLFGVECGPSKLSGC